MKEQTLTSTQPQTQPSKYDGYEDLVEPQVDGTYTKTRTKLYLSDDEVKKFFGDNDPNKYFREGKIPVYFPKAVGSLLSDDRVEVAVKNDVFSKFPDVIMFKHELANIYTLLIPKVVTEHEFANGEFVSKLVRYDTRSVVCTGGQGRPSSFETDYFKKIGSLIVKKLEAAANERKVY